MTGHQQFSVPVVLQDLSPAETLHQIVDSLAHLDSVMDSMFSQLGTKIQTQRADVQKICDRVQQCQGLVEQIAGAKNKATTVHSCNKYPAQSEMLDFERVHANTVSQPFQHSDYEITKQQREQRDQPSDITGLFSRLCGRGHHSSVAELASNVNLQEGLGRLPDHLPSLSSLLLFNSVENPYRKYVTLDNLEGEAGQDREVKQREMDAAPDSVKFGDETKARQEQIGFRPVMGNNVPAISFEANLPGLDGLASDINWQIGPDSTMSSIAPSALPSLPGLLPSSTQSSPAAGASAGTAAAPPPPGPPQPANTATNAAAPPPGPPSLTPPPLPPSIPSASSTTAAQPPPLPDKKPAPSGGLSDLLVAIQQGAKLRKKSERKAPPRNRKGKKKDSAPPAMDMMSMLKQRLQDRQNVMSGKEVTKAKKDETKDADQEPAPTGLAAAIQSVPDHLKRAAAAEMSESDDSGSDWNSD